MSKHAKFALYAAIGAMGVIVKDMAVAASKGQWPSSVELTAMACAAIFEALMMLKAAASKPGDEIPEPTPTPEPLKPTNP